MDITKLIAIVSVLVTLSIASERLVEIIKGFFPKLSEDNLEGQVEAWRKAQISILAVACGIFTAFLASPILAAIFKDLFANPSCPVFISWLGSLGTNAPCGYSLNANGFLVILTLGFLASGGSSLWNSILEYLLKIKDIKKTEAKRLKAVTEIELVRLKLESQSLNQNQ